MNINSGAPVFIVGAGRSGTTLLSHVFERDPRYWNSYENRYIWNYGQLTLAHDVRGPGEATRQVERFIRNYFARLAESKGRIIIDKTPSNIFRLGFINAVFPESKIIHIIRDGRDNVLSRQYEWCGGRVVAAERVAGRTAQYRIAFLQQRLGHLSTLWQRGNLPLVRWPTFLWDNAGPFLANIIFRKTVRYGERFPGMKQCLAAYGLLETSAIQWQMGVTSALFEGRHLPAEVYLEIRYEALLSSPLEVWDRICDFLGVEANDTAVDWLLDHARKDNVEKWRKEMSEEQRLTLEPHIRPTLEFLGYPWD